MKNLISLRILFASYVVHLVLKDFSRTERVKDANRVKINKENAAYTLKI